MRTPTQDKKRGASAFNVGAVFPNSIMPRIPNSVAGKEGEPAEFLPECLKVALDTNTFRVKEWLCAKN